MSQPSPPPFQEVLGSRRVYAVRTSAAAPSSHAPPTSGEQRPVQWSRRAVLGPGSFRSQSRYWVDRNPRSRENVMRAALQVLLGQPFVKVRPPFLLNLATKRRLELDAYNEKLRLAVEFDGEQVRNRTK